MPATHSFAEHTGELEIRLHADTLAALFEEAGRALAGVMDDRAPAGEGAYERVTLRAPDRDALLVAWLNELIFLCERDQKIFGDLRIERIGNGELAAEVRGRAAGPLRTQVKAATFHGLHVADGPHGVSATVILDV